MWTFETNSLHGKDYIFNYIHPSLRFIHAAYLHVKCYR